MNKNKKIIITILIFFHISYLLLFGKYIIHETLLYRENGKKYYVQYMMASYICSEMNNDFIPKEIKQERYKISGDYIENIKKKSTINISIPYRIFLVIQIGAIVFTILYEKEDNEHYIRKYKL